MRLNALERRQRVAGSSADVFRFFSDAYNLERITPPWLRFEVLSQPREMGAGAEIRYSLRLHGVPIRWVSRIDLWEPPHRFVDVQIQGPYRLWHHAHILEPDGDGVLMHDAVSYALPFGSLGRLVHRALVRRDLERIFDFRHDAIERTFGSPRLRSSASSCRSPRPSQFARRNSAPRRREPRCSRARHPSVCDSQA